MQDVSENWKRAHEQALLNESYVEVLLDIGDPNALADASPSDNGAIYFSNSSGLTNGVDKSHSPFATLEQNIWLLDDSVGEIPELIMTSDEYISDALSDETCVFSDKIPTITVNFSREFTEIIPGITITWSNTYGEFATDFIVRAYKSGNLVTEKEVIGNRDIKSFVKVDIVGYDQIVVSVKKWCLPNHRARVEEIFLGMSKTYGRGELFSYSHKQSASPVSTSLPKNEIQFSVDNVAGEYNPNNSTGTSQYLMERQEVKTRYGLKRNNKSIEWIKGGTFYLSEWSAKQNGMTADFTARDLLSFMTNTCTDNHDLTERNLFDLAEKVLIAAELPLNSDGKVKWHIDESLKTKYTTAPLPKDTLANCLQLIAHAGECVICLCRDGTIKIEPLSTGDTDYSINSFNSYSKPESTISKPIMQASILFYSYTMGANGIETTTNVMGSRINATGEIITIDNPLITDSHRAAEVLSWMYPYLLRRHSLDFSWRADVRLDALDTVINNENVVRMTDIEFKYNGAFRGTGKGKVI